MCTHACVLSVSTHACAGVCLCVQRQAVSIPHVRQAVCTAVPLCSTAWFLRSRSTSSCKHMHTCCRHVDLGNTHSPLEASTQFFVLAVFASVCRTVTLCLDVFLAARPQCQARSETPAHLEETKVVVVVCCDLNASACLSARFTQTDLGGKLGWCTQHGASGGAKNEWRCWRAKMKKSQSRHEN